MAEKYNSQKIEKKWQKHWAENPELFLAQEESQKEKKYILDMFPYPSGDGLHVGHVESYTATDIVSRYLRMNGKNVLHPQGFDAFGLPAENYAIKTGVHPAETTKKAIVNFTNQMNRLGFSYDWSRKVVTADPEYYKFTQWFFLLLFKNGLAEKKKAKVNWCEHCKTVLANEQVENGACERCKNQVVQKDLEQWFFKITDFIEPSFAKATDGQGITTGLLDGLDKLDWPESTKQAQRNWIGRSEGAEFKLPVILNGAARSEESQRSFAEATQDDMFIDVYTTRLDTVFGMTYAVVAPEHQILKQVQDDKIKLENKEEVLKYIEASKKKSDLMRMEAKEKTGVELKGIKVINPFTNEAIPLFVADYVLSHYGTGAVMAVPAHDERDFEFAKKHNLPIKHVILLRDKDRQVWNDYHGKDIIYWNPVKIDGNSWWWKEDYCYTDDGLLFNSGEYNFLSSEEARKKLTAWLEERGIGKGVVNYRLRDWLVSRQRYWGSPIPIIYCDTCGTVPVPEDELPVILPDDVDFKPTGESPLKYSKTFQDVKCPICGEAAKRESDTMDTFVCSSWYYFRYADPKNEKEFASKEQIEKWLPVDLYVGGAEHSVLHLLYARFFTKVLHNLGYIQFDEPFTKMRHQGIILAEDGRKMSKSLGNVVNPDAVVDEVGADALRMFEMFMGPLEDMKPWNTKGIVGIVRFLERVWRLQTRIKNQELGIENSTLDSAVHKTIKKVSSDIQEMRFNTAISALMILLNEFEKNDDVSLIHYSSFLILLSPFAPHIAEELWSKLGHENSIFTEKWPTYDEKLISEENIQLVIQVNGKLRDTVEISADISEEDAKKIALDSEKVNKFIDGQEVKKVIYIKGRLVNIVV